MSITKSPEIFFPSPGLRKEYIQTLHAEIDEIKDTIVTSQVIADTDLSNFNKDLQAITFTEPKDLRQLVSWLLEHLKTGMVQMTHPGYLGLFNPAPTFPSEVADHIMAALNPQICVWSHAPVAVDIEAHTIALLCQRLGFPEQSSSGHFTSGGSEANATAFICALTSACENFTQYGAASFKKMPRVYISNESHLAWLKIAHMSGLGRASIVLVPTDGLGKMDTTALEHLLEDDVRNGYQPIMLVSTAGTTNAGMVDPITENHRIAQKYKLWHHVDAAWAGAVIVSDEYKPLLSGIDLVDSVTIDAHKWFATTMGTGMILMRNKAHLAASFHVDTDYMPSNDQSRDLYVNSIQWSRRFSGLRLFLSLATVGWEGYSKHIKHSIQLISYFCEEIGKLGWNVLNDTSLGIACVVPPKGSGTIESILQKVLATETYWISQCKFENQSALRLCVTNGTTEKSHIDGLIKALQVAARM